MWDTIKSIEEPEPIQKKDIFFLGKELRKTRFYMDVHKKKKRHWVPPPQTKQAKGEFFHLFCIVLAAWPSGKAGDCKSFFPSSNPGVAWSTKNLKSLFFFCWYNPPNDSPAEAEKADCWYLFWSGCFYKKL